MITDTQQSRSVEEQTYKIVHVWNMYCAINHCQLSACRQSSAGTMRTAAVIVTRTYAATICICTSTELILNFQSLEDPTKNSFCPSGGCYIIQPASFTCHVNYFLTEHCMTALCLLLEAESHLSSLLLRSVWNFHAITVESSAHYRVTAQIQTHNC